ncbi:hypothetical protein GCM10007877_00640 [Marinibactrum halimedae]|uniref:Uncharacterized protein n=2 Tax=Marinibactrum halimedae TaxID=1444977 RepID=A0AA37T158_9GAMM|nr:hypothetical protein GCM10007877_00640 [Marinibactrum halimedae]
MSEGDVYCWKNNSKGVKSLSQLTKVDFSKNKAISIYGQSGDSDHFDTGYHACALMENNDVWCWGDLNEDTLLHFNDLFSKETTSEMSEGRINAIPLKKSAQNQLGKIKSLQTKHGTICSIDEGNTLNCPQQHISFLSGSPDVKQFISGEVISCIQNLDNLVECFDMRSNEKPLFYLQIEEPSQSSPIPDTQGSDILNFRYYYSSGLCKINSNHGLSCWSGTIPSAFPDDYSISAKSITLPDALGAKDIVMSEKHACVALNNGAASCWGIKVALEPLPFDSDRVNLTKFNEKENFVPAPGIFIKFPETSIIDIALGELTSCFLLDNNSVQCFH